MNGPLRNLCAATAAAVLLAGCIFGAATPPASTIDASDGNVLQPVLRVTVDIPSARGAPSDPHTGHAIEFGYTRGAGSSSQALNSNYVAFGGRQFNAPATLNYDFTLSYVDFTYRWRMLDESGTLGFEALSGIAFADLDFAVSSATQRANESLSSPGVQVGLGALWRMRPGTSAHLRGTWFLSGDENGVSKASRSDAYLMQALARHITVRAGYAFWTLDSSRGGGLSPISVEFRGPTLGLEVLF